MRFLSSVISTAIAVTLCAGALSCNSDTLAQLTQTAGLHMGEPAVRGAVSGSAWDPLAIELRGADGEPVDVGGVPVQLSLTQGTGVLGGTLVRTLSGGVASFDDLTYDTIEEITLEFSVNEALPGLSALEIEPTLSVDIAVTGAPAALAFSIAPHTSAQVDQPFSVFAVEVRDSGGRRVLAESGRLLEVAPMGSPADTLSGTLVQSTKYGVAAFSDVQHDTLATLTLEVSDESISGSLDTIMAPKETSVEAAPMPTSLFVVSFGESEDAADDNSREPVVSADGRFVTFESEASNLPSGVTDDNNNLDVYLYDLVDDVTEAISVDSAGTIGNGRSCYPAISADGRWIAFNSGASNLIADDGNQFEDLFLRDRREGTTFRISRGPDGQAPDGRSDFPEMSKNGRYTAWHSIASNLVEGDTNGQYDIFVYDLVEDTLERVSVADGGAEAGGGGEGARIPDISDDGRIVAFHSTQTDLVPGDTNGVRDVFAHDRQTGVTERISVSSAGAQGLGSSRDVAISGDGRYVVFSSLAPNLVSGDTNGNWDIFLRDRQSGTTTQVSVDDAGEPVSGASRLPSMSEDANRIVFQSHSGDFDDNDTNGVQDIYLRDRMAGTTIGVSVNNSGYVSDAHNSINYISPDGHFVAWEAFSDKLAAPTDDNGHIDILMVGVDDNPQP